MNDLAIDRWLFVRCTVTGEWTRLPGHPYCTPVAKCSALQLTCATTAFDNKTKKRTALLLSASRWSECAGSHSPLSRWELWAGSSLSLSLPHTPQRCNVAFQATTPQMQPCHSLFIGRRADRSFCHLNGRPITSSITLIRWNIAEICAERAGYTSSETVKKADYSVNCQPLSLDSLQSVSLNLYYA